MVLFGALAFRNNDAMSKAQRDITESLERSKASKAQRDSFEYYLSLQRQEKFRYYARLDSLHDVAVTFPDETYERIEPFKSDIEINRSRILPNEAFIPKGRMFATNAMDGLVPREKETIFHTGNPVFIYAGIHAPCIEEIRVEWLDRNGKCIEAPTYITVLPNTGETGYRIYVYRKFETPGRYEARIYNSTNKLIGSTKFTVESAYRARVQPREIIIASAGG
jgi:hypothetical protein